MSELAALKAISKAKESEEKRLQERRRNVLVLILRHLADHGYADTYEKLCTESNLSLQKVDVADNIDLLRILQEFEESYELKFGKRPKVVRRLVEEVAAGGGGVRARAVSAGPGSSAPLVGGSGAAAPSSAGGAAQRPHGGKGGHCCPHLSPTAAPLLS
ncbi:Katanin p60 ATPase-containing subunit A-like 2 [Pleodorina starrii]|nr:Katanin p60 ATPase-containing subunit A-like 2 [Pleodorina starrii]